jgi:Calx-beta domain
MRIRRLAIVLAVVVSTLVSIGVGALPAGADSAPSVDVGDVTMARSTTAVTNFVFPVTLEYASNNTVTVNYITQNGTARSTKDYTAEQGTVTFAPGTLSKTVTVPVQASTLHTGQLYFFLSISAPTNAVVNRSSGTGTILDPTLNPYLNIGDTTVTEGTGSAATATFTTKVSTASANPITFKYATANGSAVAGIDYTAEHGTVTVAAGQVSAQIAVPVTKSSQYSASKNFYVTLSAATNATLGTNQGIGTILYANHAAWVTVDDATVTASTTATTTMNFAVRLTSAATFPVTVDYGTADGSATAANQYVSAFGSLTFAPGVTSMTVPVTVNSALSGAATTSFVLNLGSASPGSNILRSSATGTIGGPTAGYHQLTVGDVGLVRGTSGTSTLTFAVALQSASTSTVTVKYATQDNTAAAPGDYTAKSGTLTFSPGQTTQNVAITIVGTTTTFSDRNFFLTLSAATGATLIRRGVRNHLEREF